MLQCVAVCCSVLQCVAVCCSVSQCVAVCRSVLQCVCALTATYLLLRDMNTYLCTRYHFSRYLRKRLVPLLKLVAFQVCCSVMQCVMVCCSVLQRVAACCSVLQCVVCCSVLQRVAACCNMMQYVGACTLLMPAGALQMRCVAVSVGVDPMAAATHI